MPYFRIQTSNGVDSAKKAALCHELGRIIELVPGKSESWVMVHIEDNAAMSFAGNSTDPTGAVFLKTFGELKPEFYDMLTKELCGAMSAVLGLDPKRVYVIFEPIAHWGWNGSNF